MSFTRGQKQAGGFRPNGELVDMPGRHSRDGWTHRADHASVYLEGKQYRNMREWSRPCVVCSGDILAFEKSGTVDANSRFSNKTCKDHRGLLPAMERGYIAWSADLKGIVAGAKCVGADTSELAAVKTERDEYANAVMDHLTDRGKFVREIAALKERLAKYELPAAMAAIQNKHPWE